jgi:hypothetical protein
LSIEDINKDFKVGDILKGMFHVCHDEAYCDCDGVIVDIKVVRTGPIIKPVSLSVQGSMVGPFLII